MTKSFKTNSTFFRRQWKFNCCLRFINSIISIMQAHFVMLSFYEASLRVMYWIALAKLWKFYTNWEIFMCANLMNDNVDKKVSKTIKEKTLSTQWKKSMKQTSFCTINSREIFMKRTFSIVKKDTFWIWLLFAIRNLNLFTCRLNDLIRSMMLEYSRLSSFINSHRIFFWENIFSMMLSITIRILW